MGYNKLVVIQLKFNELLSSNGPTDRKQALLCLSHVIAHFKHIDGGLRLLEEMYQELVLLIIFCALIYKSSCNRLQEII